MEAHKINYKIQFLILNSSNIDAHLEDEAGYSVVIHISTYEFTDYLISKCGYYYGDVQDNLRHNADYYIEDFSEWVADNKTQLAISYLFHQARIDEAEHEQQLINKQSFNHTENNF